MRASTSPAIRQILSHFGVPPDALLGHGGEAVVYARNAAQVLRIFRPGASRAAAERRRNLLAEFNDAAGSLPFAIPQVLDIHEHAEHIISVEARLPGRPLMDVLAAGAAPNRPVLIRAYLDAAAAIGDIAVSRPWYGELLDDRGLRTTSFHDYLAQRAALNLRGAGPAFAAIDPVALAAALPVPDRPALVHLDAFPGNMLSDGAGITAVVDFGTVSLMGDRRLDPLSAAAYLEPAISPPATDADRAVAAAWLAEKGLADWYRPARRWLAAFWSFATDDGPLHNWCRSVLLT